MSDDGRLDITPLVRSVAHVIAQLPLEELRAHVAACERSLERADSFGAILDPTGYRDALCSGRLDDAKDQITIARAILAAREAIEARDVKIVARVAQKVER